MLCTPGWTFRGLAMASATALFSPWPYSSMCLAEIIRIRVVFGAESAAPDVAPISIVPDTRRRGCPRHQVPVPVMGVA